MAMQLVPAPPPAINEDAASDGGSDDDAAQQTVSGVDHEASDGLLVAARGLGLQRVVVGQLVAAHATPHNLVLLLGCSSEESRALFASLKSDSVTSLLGAETPPATRNKKYSSGGVVCVSSRVLVVDLLNGNIDAQKVTGVLLCHAHRTQDTSTEAFILRLIREKNKVAFIRAFSEDPEALAHSGVMWRLEKTMKLLFLRKVFFWPRFHMQVQEAIDAVPPIAVRQVRVPMTKLMSDIQAGIIDCINESILEVKRVHRFIDPEELNVENALFSSFASLLKIQLDPIWHKVSPHTKKVVQDIGTLRRLLGYLTTYDSVAFYSYLESVQSANALDPLINSAAFDTVSPWLMLDATDVVFSSAKKRVFKKSEDASAAREKNQKRFGSASLINVPEGVEIVAEEQPKWGAVCDLVMNEVRKQTSLMAAGGESGSVAKTTTPHPPATSTATAPSTDQDPPAFTTPGAKTLLSRVVLNYFKWKGSVASIERNQHLRAQFKKGGNSRGGGANSRGGSSLRGGAGFRGAMRGGGGGGGGGSGSVRGMGGVGGAANLRRRARGGAAASVGGWFANRVFAGISDVISGEGDDDAGGIPNAGDVLDDAGVDNDSGPPPLEQAGKKKWLDSDAPLDLSEYQSHFEEIDVRSSIVIRPYATSILNPSGTGAYMTNGEEDSRMLEEVRPSSVVMYDVDTAFIRRLEVFHALNGGSPAMTVYFMIYDNSIEEQKYLTSLRKEKESFEKLIREKANMAIPIDQDGRVVDPDDVFWRNLDTRIAGGQTIPAADANQIIVDVREFRSALPSLLHTHRMKLRPCTLLVGDYILTPQICVERKSIPDLIGSFKSGRLYTQTEAMCLHYDTPVLLIEFAAGKSFSLGPVGGNGGMQPEGEDLNCKLVLLAVTFPKLRIVWSQSPAATAEIFEDLKKDQREPSVEDAMRVGLDANDPIDSIFSITPSDMIRALPGITSKNYRNIMQRVDSIAAIAEMGVEECKVLVGEEGGRELWEFMNLDLRKK
ncbi:hypothetical protein HDU98_001574 [Podochytrium sp. JEL0797]|nr:hypothetical protein HDU98_001574 [Podochytrium sp. JEL0797]